MSEKKISVSKLADKLAYLKENDKPAYVDIILKSGILNLLSGKYGEKAFIYGYEFLTSSYPTFGDEYLQEYFKKYPLTKEELYNMLYNTCELFLANYIIKKNPEWAEQLYNSIPGESRAYCPSLNEIAFDDLQSLVPCDCGGVIEDFEAVKDEIESIEPKGIVKVIEETSQILERAYDDAGDLSICIIDLAPKYIEPNEIK